MESNSEISELLAKCRSKIQNVVVIRNVVVMLVSSSLSSSNLEDPSWLMGLPILIVINVLFLIFTAILGYFAGYLSVPAK